MVRATAIEGPTRPLRVGMVGGGRDAFIGAVHRMALRLDDLIRLEAGALSADPDNARLSGADLRLSPDRVYLDYREMAARESVRPDGIEAVLRVFNEDIEVAILVENAGGARRREFHEDRGARICILAGRRPPKPDTFEADGSTAELNKPLADGAGHTFSTAPSARAQKSWVRISMPRRQISRP